MRQKQRWRGLLKKNTPVYEEGDVQYHFPIIMGCDVDMKTCWIVVIIPRFNQEGERDYSISDVGDMLVSNSVEGYEKLLKWTQDILETLPKNFSQPYLDRDKHIPFVAESTGPYTQTFFRLMDGTDSPYMPYMINALMQDRRGKKAKTDKADARNLATKARAGALTGFHPYKFLPPGIEALRMLTRDRAALIKERTAWHQRLSALLIYYGVTLSTSYEKDGNKKDTPYASRSAVWHSRGGINLLYELIDIGKATNKQQLHELGEHVDITPAEAEVHLNGLLTIPDTVLHNVIQPRLEQTKALDKRIIQIESQIISEMENRYPEEYEISLSCPSFGPISASIIFSESGNTKCLQEKFTHVKQYQWYCDLGMGRQITGGKLIGVMKPAGNKRLGWIYRLIAKSVLRTKAPESEQLRNWGLSLQHRKNYLSAVAGVARRLCHLWYYAITKEELCTLDNYNFHAARDGRKREITKAAEIIKGIDLTDDMSIEESLQLGQLVQTIGKSLGQNVTYIINPDHKQFLVDTEIEQIFHGNRTDNRIAYFLRKAGIFDLETLVARVVTNTLITIPQIGNATVEHIINRLIEKQYIFDVTDRTYQKKRHYSKNEETPPEETNPSFIPKEEEIPY